MHILWVHGPHGAHRRPPEPSTMRKSGKGDALAGDNPRSRSPRSRAASWPRSRVREWKKLPSGYGADPAAYP
jgi:hypothetical protein